MYKELQRITNRLEQINNNLRKNPNRKFSSKYILRTSVELKELREELNENLDKLIKAKVNPSLLEHPRERFLNLYKYIEDNLTERILAITKPGDTTIEELGEIDTEEKYNSESETEEASKMSTNEDNGTERLAPPNSRKAESILVSGKNQHDLQEKVNQELNKMNQWLQGNQLLLNAEKTVYLLFKEKNKKNIELKLQINGRNIQRATSVKYLGVVIDEKLSWAEHIDKLEKKIYPLIGALRRCGKIPRQIVLMIYNSYILSLCLSSILSWCCSTRIQLDRIEKILCRALRTLLGLDWFTSKREIRNITKTFSVMELIQIEKSKLIYRIKNKLIKTRIQLTSNQEVHRFNTRNSEDLRIQIYRTGRSVNGLISSSILLFNNIEQNIKQKTTLMGFTKALKNDIIQKRNIN